MASVVGEAVIGGMTKAAVASLLSKLSQELSRIPAFQEDVEALRSQFTTLHGFAQSAYYNNRMEDYILGWVEKVEDYVFQAEDILKDCSWWHLCNDNSASSSSSSSNVLRKVYKSPQNAWHKWKISRRISYLSKELRLMEEMAVQHGLTRQHRPTPVEESEEKTAGILFDEPVTVGLDAKVSEFLSLVEAHPRIGVVGMGGVGKTRLLQHVYKEIKSKFELSVWLCISQIYDVNSLQMDILHGIGKDNSEIEALSKLTNQTRALKIHEALKEKACLIVLDDVWSSDPTRMEGSLPENDLLKALGLPENVKILVSTRRLQVVIDMRAYHYQLHPLSQEDSKKLFCLYSFGNPEFHEHQQDRLMKIIEGCHNLPLALKTTARVLALHYGGNPGRFPLPEEEEEEEGGVRSYNVLPMDPVTRCLMRSYNVLPMDLKRCFTYMAVFPEDDKIDGSRVVTLWMAEGFVSSRQRGQNVLNSLCDRCLVERLPTEFDDWSWRYCARYKMHDLIRDLAISIFHKVGGFCKGSVDEFQRALLCKRRVSLIGHSKEGLSDFCGPQLRSLFLEYKNDNLHNKRFTHDNKMYQISRRARGLRVLSNPCVRSCSRKVLSRLVFLELRGDPISERLRDARSLEYLLLRTSCGLPRWIGELTRLTHLEIIFRSPAVKSLERLVNLRVLRAVEIHDEFSFRDLSNLQKLNELQCYTGLEPEKMEEWTPPQSMQCLQFSNILHACDMPESWKAMTSIQCLHLYRVTLTAGCQAFQKLTHLVLSSCSGNPPVEIAKLPRLTALRLERFESCSELPDEYGMSWAFPSLEHFVIVQFPLLRKLPNREKGAMRSLRTLAVGYCPNFNFNELAQEFSTTTETVVREHYCMSIVKRWLVMPPQVFSHLDPSCTHSPPPLVHTLPLPPHYKRNIYFSHPPPKTSKS